MNIRFYPFVLVLTLLIADICLCQEPVFNNGDRVCFIGNSITMNGTFYHYINLFYATRYPERKLTFYNCGISGDITGGILKRLESDILIHQPNWSVLMIGMNDVKRNLYAQARENELGIKEKRQTALDIYFKNVDSIIQKLLQAKSKVILQTPSIYDQTGYLRSENYYGTNDALKICAEYLRQLAEKYKLPLVDYWTILSDINKKIQLKDSTKTIIGSDRVHPNKLGHFVMANQFLNSLPVLKQVSHLIIDAKQKKVIQSFNCTVNGINAITNNLSFTYLCNSLPFPTPADLNTDSLHSFTDEMNADIVEIKGLVAGNYKLIIDTSITDIYSNTQFEKGVNLSKNKNTPQYQQARQVLNLFNDYWAIETLLRITKYVEYEHLRNLKNKADMEEIKKYLDVTLERSKSDDNYGFFERVFKIYQENKPHEKELYSKSDSILNNIQQVNLPIKHVYKIVRII